MTFLGPSTLSGKHPRCATSLVVQLRLRKRIGCEHSTDRVSSFTSPNPQREDSLREAIGRDPSVPHGVILRVPSTSVAGLISAVAGTFLQQAALHVGPRSVSQPLLPAVDPFASIVLSMWLFDEDSPTAQSRSPSRVVSFAVMVAGVSVLLISSRHHRPCCDGLACSPDKQGTPISPAMP